MIKSTKIAISLPKEMLRTIERERRAVGASRSEFLRHAVQDYLRRQRHQEAVEQYVRGYQLQPETAEEVAWTEAVSLEVLKEYPWDDEEPG